MGAGLEMREGDIAFKSNFAFMDDGGIVRRRRADRNFQQWGTQLCHLLSSWSADSQHCLASPSPSLPLIVPTAHLCVQHAAVLP
jgi:2,3-bisphosphoglycerate-independent phosphoglycerate mutase